MLRHRALEPHSQATKTGHAELEKAKRTLQHSMSRSQWEAVAAAKRITAEKNIGGVHGMLLELFTANPEYFTAIEVAAGGQLFQMVVDNDDVAARLSAPAASRTLLVAPHWPKPRYPTIAAALATTAAALATTAAASAPTASPCHHRGNPCHHRAA